MDKIVPISHTEIPEKVALTDGVIDLILPKLVVYIFSFLVVCHSWSQHVWIMKTVSHVDDFMVLLNLAMMMVVTFLPFTFTLLGAFTLDSLAIQLFSCTIILVGLSQLAFILHVFRNRDLLIAEIRESSSWEAQRNGMIASVLTPVAMAIVALSLSWCPIAADVTLVLMIFGNFFRRILIKIYRKVSERRRPSSFDIMEESPYVQRLFTEKVAKERAEAYSDGVYAIVATLIILDICESNIPTDKLVEEYGSLNRALARYSQVYVAYAGTFVTVGLLWYVHHTLFHCLMCIGGMPLAFQLTSRYYENELYRDETISIQINCVLIFLAGLGQMIMWVTALYFQDQYLHTDAHFGNKEHAYITAKLAVLPLLSLFVYFLSFASFAVKTQAFEGMQIGAIGVFVILQLAYIAHKKARRRLARCSGLETSTAFSDGSLDGSSSLPL
ncbi:hypothetical protein CAPTEDRAFT_225004 [Capitella teleta]|uniref:Endosomal/lysosomal proton channel TMEM175 n=1 Tax=Capitella teleta TaxID=283909 RepID=R7V738_CAPTE|nr:hypothetical protein CAPTEDRAFT_225004 [Capitella teleta]|eukprot:ELU12171.1 hypothetical protein CAPTEDRAFT_225004 [Capitella teleta]